MRRTPKLRKTVILLLVFLFTLTQLYATPISSNVSGMEQTLKTIASVQFAGRLAGTEGNKLCGEYLVNQFQTIGLEKFDSDSYYQEHTQEIYPQDKQVHEMTVTFINGQTKSYTYGSDYIDKVKASDLNIKCTAVFNPDTANLTQIAILDSAEKLSQISSKARAVLIKSDNFSGSITPRDTLTPVFQITPDFYNELTNNKIKTIAIQSKYEKSTTKAANVIGKIKGADSKNALVLSAHYDHVGTAGQTVFQGAADNASGVTLLLDLARRLQAQSQKATFKTDIYICAFNGEEGATPGSNTFIQSIKSEYTNLYNINLDCPGIKGQDTLSIMGNQTWSQELMKELGQYADKCGIPYKVEDGFGSDHRIFLSNGINAINLGQVDMNIIHTQKDTPDKIDCNYLKKISDMVFDFTISNDGKTFKSNTLQQIPPTLYGKLGKIIGQEAPKLAYDEIKYIEIDGFRCSFTGTRNRVAAQDIKKYYPNMQYPESIGGAKLKEAVLYCNDFYTIYTDNSVPQEAVGTIQKRTISTEKLINIILFYEKDGILTAISINPLQDGQKHPMTRLLNRSEIVQIKGQEYYLARSLTNDGYVEINNAVTINGKSYFVTYDRFKDDKMQELSRGAYLHMVEECGAEELVEGLGI